MLMFTELAFSIYDQSILLKQQNIQPWKIINTAENIPTKKSFGYDRSLNLDLVTFPLGKRLDQA
ncbi:hypothetical protein C5745_12490 [Sphingobacterium haloxyli]|uniref:Uncharacterized protein n=1 Tax=Sphingobacterium haloxyli TaxID=2100533 RepID=A0A2S9J2C1_9SPHI|nr:hypothetical protein C5745_12490 [Sphingobacterium haloxyli]